MPLRREVRPNATRQGSMPNSIRSRVIGESRHPQRLFDNTGAFNKDVRGVNRESLWAMAWFHNVVEMSWPVLLFTAALKFLAVNIICAAIYYLIALHCGAEVTAIIALYFNAVTLVGNGGYMGEDLKMTTPGSSCYDQRTILVLFESYLNIAISGVIAALFVTKVASHRSTRHYIVFSNFVCASNFEYESLFDDVRADINVRDVVEYTRSGSAGSLTPRGPHSPSNSPSVPLRNPVGSKNGKGAAQKQDPETNVALSADGGHLSFRVGSIHNESVIGGQLRVFVVAQTKQKVDASNTRRGVLNGHGKVLQRTTQIGFTVLEEDHDEAYSDLLLWTPVTVVIPLANNALLARAIFEGTGGGGGGGGKNHPIQVASDGQQSSTEPTVDVQLVAVFQGTDSVTGSTIETSHCYTMNEVLKHYHFTFNMLDCELGEEAEGKSGRNDNVMKVDYNHFNEVVSDF